MTATPPEQEIKPCPFCDAPSILHECDWSDPSTWSVECSSDACWHSHKTQAEAIAAWNRRASIDTLRQDNERLRQALQPFANIKLSTLYADNENEGYAATLDHYHAEFRRSDIVAARAALEGK